MQNTTVPFHLIRVGERMRKDLGDIDSLAESIANPEIGLICPLTVEECEDGFFDLVAGGRRHAAITQIRNAVADIDTRLAEDDAGFFVKPVPFDQVPVYIKHNLSLSSRKTVELEENLRRKAMNWQEQAIAIAEVHAEHERTANLDGQSWTNKMTGDLIGYSHAHVVYATKLAEHILAGDEEIIKCENATEAIQLLLKRSQKEVEKREAILKAAALATRKAAQEVGRLVITSGDESDATRVADSFLHDNIDRLDAYERSLSIILHADSHLWMRDSSCDCVDGIYTDIPYGIDVDNLALKHIGETAAEHDRDENIELFADFLSLSYKVLRPESFLVFWYDVEHTSKLLTMAKSIGFRVQRWPLHAFKGHGKNEAASFNTTKDYESVLICAKTNATLAEKRSTSQVPWEWADGERNQYSHPFAKPHAAHEWILKTFFRAGQRILDPYCGEGSLVLSGLKLGYDMFGIDKVETHVIRARNHVEKLLTSK